MNTAARDAALKELNTLHEDVWWTEKGHFWMAGYWSFTRSFLGILSIAASVVSGATIVADKSLVAGIAALLAGLLTGAITFLKPDESRQAHLSSGRELGALRVRLRQFRDVNGLPRARSSRRLAHDLRAFSEAKAAVDGRAPHVPNIAIWVVNRRKSRGAFD